MRTYAGIVQGRRSRRYPPPLRRFGQQELGLRIGDKEFGDVDPAYCPAVQLRVIPACPNGFSGKTRRRSNGSLIITDRNAQLVRLDGIFRPDTAA